MVSNKNSNEFIKSKIQDKVIVEAKEKINNLELYFEIPLKNI
tara:strand:- start:4611 stop:4736 length:126 start_codon:yes stop_codon:yes gene_type:complete